MAVAAPHSFSFGKGVWGGTKPGLQAGLRFFHSVTYGTFVTRGSIVTLATP
jgi:hypothetical protein